MADKRERINVSLDSETVDRLRKLAREAHISASDWIALRVWEHKLNDEKQAEKEMAEAKDTEILDKLMNSISE